MLVSLIVALMLAAAPVPAVTADYSPAPAICPLGSDSVPPLCI